MKNIWIVCGRIVFWLTWPVLKIRLNLSRRVRAVIYYKDEILVVKSWIGNSKWTIPGGGIKIGEASIDALIREVKEEVGIELKSTSCQNVGDFIYNSTGLRYRYALYAIKLKAKPSINVNKTEIVDAEWLKLSKINQSNSNSDAINAKNWLKS